MTLFFKAARFSAVWSPSTKQSLFSEHTLPCSPIRFAKEPLTAGCCSKAKQLRLSSLVIREPSDLSKSLNASYSVRRSWYCWSLVTTSLDSI
ncbi:hypothetical protein LEMLEM_LOCUS24624 [Lemmus lemmus]